MNVLFMVTMIIEGIFALGFIIAPAAMLGQFGVTLNNVAATLARLFGAAVLSFPVLLWYGRRSDKAEFKTGVVRSLFVYYLASTPILLLTQTTGLMNPKGWSIIGLHLVLLVWFGIFALKRS